MRDDDIFWGTIPVNSNTETIGGITVPKVRAIEISDPVYYMTDDSQAQDLRNRDVALATAIQNNLGGWFHHYVDPTQLQPDSSTPFEYGSVIGKTICANFTASLTAKAYFQFTIGKNVNKTEDLYFKIHYCMSTSASSKNVGLIFSYDIVQDTDNFTTPSVSTTRSETFNPPTVQYVLENHYSPTIFVITAAELALITTDHAVVTCSLTRDISVTDNHAGKFMLVGITAYQPV